MQTRKSGAAGQSGKTLKQKQKSLGVSKLKDKRLFTSIHDSTDRKEKLMNLDESEVRFQDLFDKINTCVAVYEAVDDGKDFIFKDINMTALRIEKISKEEVLGRRVSKVFPGIREMHLLDIFRRVWKSGKSEYQPVTRYEDKRLVGWRENWVYKLPSGEIVAVYEDATERKQQEEEIRNRAEELAALQTTIIDISLPHPLPELLHLIVERAAILLHASSGGLYLADPQKRQVHCVVSYNTALDFSGTVLAYGEGSAGLVAQTGKPLIINDYRHWSGRAKVFENEQPFRVLISAPFLWQGKVTGVVHVLRENVSQKFTQKDLRLLMMFANHAALAVENTRLMEAAYNEILARKQAEETIRTSEQRLSLVFDTVGDILFLLAVEPHDHFRFESVNHNFLTVTGLKQEQVEGKLMQEVLPPTAHALVLGKYKQAIQENRTIRWEEVSAYPTGTLYGDVSVTPAWNSAGVCTHLIGSVHDITEIRRRQQEIQILSRFAGENPNPVMRISNLGKILFANTASDCILQMWGKKAGQVLPREFKDFVLNSIQSKQNQEIEINCGERIFSFILVPIIKEDYLNLYGRDITEHKQAEEQLRYQAALLANVNDAIVASDAQYRLTVWNKAAESLYGWKAEEVLGQNGLEIVRTEWPTLKADEMRRTIAETGLWRGEATQARKDGRRIPVEISSLVVRDGSGQITGYISVNRDITERKQAEKFLLASEQRYRNIFEDSPVSLWEEDFSAVKQRLDALRAQGVTDMRAYLESHPQEVADCAALVRVMDVNKAGLDLFKTKKKDDLLRDLLKNLSPQSLEDFREELVNIAEGKTKFNWEWVNQTLTGEQINTSLIWSVVPGHESDLSKVFVSVVDITQRKQAEQVLAESENKFRWLYEYAPIAYHILTPDGIIMDVNRRWCQVLDYSREEVLGKEIFDFIVEEERKAARASFIHKKAGKQTFIEGSERNYLTKAGAVRTFKTYDFLVMDQSQNITFIQTTLEDITERKQAEKFLLASEQRYRNIFEDSPISLWEEDFSAVKQRLNALRAQGVTDMRAYLESHPQEVADCAALVKIVDVNKAGLNLFKAKKKDDLLNNLSKILSPQSLKDFYEELVNIAEGRTNFHWEGVNQTLTGEQIDISLTFSVVPGYEGDLSKTLLTISDITDRKNAEKEMRRLISDLRNLSEVEKKNRLFAEALAKNVISIRSTLNTDEILDSIIESINDVVPADAINIMLIEGEHARIVRSRGYQERGLTDWTKQWQVGLDEIKTLKEIIRSKKHKIIFNTDKSKDWTVIAETSWIKSNIISPILDDKTVIGFVNLDSATPDFFTEEQAQHLAVFTDQVSTALKNARLYEATQQRMQRMQAMTQIDQAINSSLDLNISLEIILSNAKEQLSADAVDILLLNGATNSLVFSKAKGFQTDEIHKTNLELGRGLPGRAVLERTTVAIPDLKSAEESYFKNLLVEREGFISYYCVPLITKGELKGVMEVYFRHVFQASQEWLEFLEMLAQQTAIAINNAELLVSLQVSNIELLSSYETTLKGWVDALDMRDKETEGHTQRVTELSLKLARQLGVKDADIIHFRRGALLHDIGKVAISDSILNKPGPLTEEEWVIMRGHPLIAFQLLSKSKYLLPALDIPYCHHEKWDGSGYPRGLKGEAIPLAARIFAIVDVWDALISDRPYRKAWTKKKALEYIQEQSGKHFDPEVVKVFLKNHLAKNIGD